MASADGYALPKPAIPKTLGILNVIFAVLLILGGLCTGISILVAPAFVQIAQKAQQDAKKQGEAQRAAQLKTLDDRAKDATTDEEKATIAKERETAAANTVPEPPDIAASMDTLKDPRVIGYTAATVITGLILHITLLVAGIGLIRLAPWGRSLGIWWAGLQILQLLILGVVQFTLILPIQREASAKQIAELKKQLDVPNPPPNAGFTLQIAESSAKLTAVWTAAYLVGGLVYPILCLALLRTAGARAACVGRAPTKPPTMGYDSI